MTNLLNTIKEQDTTTKIGLAIVGLVIVPLALSLLYHMAQLGAEGVAQLF